MHSPWLLLWGLENCFEITLKECWKVPVCKEKAAKKHCLTQNRKRIGKRERRSDISLFLMIMFGSAFSLVVIVRTREVSKCNRMLESSSSQIKKAKRNMFDTEHKEDWKETSVQLQRCLCQWSEPLLTWLWPEEEHMDFSNLLHTWVFHHWYMDFSKLLHGFVKVILFISQWCLCQWSEPLLTRLWEEEEEADW